MVSVENLRRANFRQGEDLLAHYLSHENAGHTRRWANRLAGELSGVAVEFGAQSEERRLRLAQDVAACMRLYHAQRDHGGEGNTVASMASKVAQWTPLLQVITDRYDVVRQSKDIFSNSLTGIAALEFFFERLIDEAGRATLGRGLSSHMAKSTALCIVRDSLTQARVKMLTGRSGTGAVLHEVQVHLRREIDRRTNDIAEMGDDESQGFLAHLRSVLSLVKVLAAIFDEHDEDRILGEAAFALQADLQSIPKEAKRKKVAPVADSTLAWSLCLLIDGWKPRIRHAHSGRRLRQAAISSKSNGYLARLMRDLAVIDAEDSAVETESASGRFSYSLKEAAKAFNASPRLGEGAPRRLFANRLHYDSPAAEEVEPALA